MSKAKIKPTLMTAAIEMPVALKPAVCCPECGEFLIRTPEQFWTCANPVHGKLIPQPELFRRILDEIDEYNDERDSDHAPIRLSPGQVIYRLLSRSMATKK